MGLDTGETCTIRWTETIDAMKRKERAKASAETAVLHGTFTRRRGRTSSYYIDKYQFLTRPDILRQLGAMIASSSSFIKTG